MEADTLSELREPEFTFPPDEGELVAREYANAGSILEYGSGGSTVLAARSTNAQVLSIESDKNWADELIAFLKSQDVDLERVKIHWANIGPTAKWGYPADQSRWRKYPSYALGPWERFDISPDVVLIDGRFRLACLAATMMFAKKPTTVLFDDFANRAAYHGALEFLTPAKIVGRMAKFEVSPNSLDAKSFSTMVRWFFTLK